MFFFFIITYSQKSLSSTNAGIPGSVYIAIVLSWPLIGCWATERANQKAAQNNWTLGSQVLFPENRQLKSIFIQEQTEIVQTILFLDFLARLPLKHVLCIEYVRSLHGLWFVHQKETVFFCFCVCQLQQ